MQTFRVVKEHHGWAVRLGDSMSTPFWTRAMAIREAECLCESLRRHGVMAQISIEADAEGEADREPPGAVAG